MAIQSRIIPSQRRAVVLLSGGLDSYTAAAIAKTEGFQLYALTIRYGQRHVREIDAARRVAAALAVERHIELDVDLSAFGGSALTGDIPVPKNRAISNTEIPSTYVPARNTRSTPARPFQPSQPRTCSSALLIEIDSAGGRFMRIPLRGQAI